jgi:hypothetical protein
MLAGGKGRVELFVDFSAFFCDKVLPKRNSTAIHRVRLSQSVSGEPTIEIHVFPANGLA